MTDMERLRAWSDENLLASFEFLVRHPPTGEPIASREFGGVRAFPAGRRSGFFNAVAILAPAQARDVEAAVGWVRDLGQSVSLRVREDVDDSEVREAARNLGLERSAWVDPAMVLHPITDPPPVPRGLPHRGGHGVDARPLVCRPCRERRGADLPSVPPGPATAGDRPRLGSGAGRRLPGRSACGDLQWRSAARTRSGSTPSALPNPPAGAALAPR